jgi:hypothetical protein
VGALRTGIASEGLAGNTAAEIRSVAFSGIAALVMKQSNRKRRSASLHRSVWLKNTASLTAKTQDVVPSNNCASVSVKGQ